jgi:vitamin B12 transporter
MKLLNARARARRSRLLAGTAGLFALAAGPALAAEVGGDVEEVVVTVHIEETLPQELSRYGVHLETVSGQRIQDGGYVDVGQVLQYEVPGLSLIPQSGPFSYNTASLQGSRPGEILYLVDGVRISNRLYNSTPPLDTVPAHMVQRIEVLESGQGLFYGAQAVAGVVNIVSRDPTTNPSGRFEIGANTNDGYNASAWLSGGMGASKFGVFASRDWAKGFQPFPDADYEPSGTDRNRGYKLYSIGAKYAYEPGADLRVSASYTHTQGWVDNARPVSAAAAKNYRNEEIAYAKVDYDPTERFGFYLKGYWHDWRSHYDEFDNTPAGLDHVDDYEVWAFHDIGLNAVAKYVAAKGVELWGGYDVQAYGGHDDVLLIARQNETAHAVFGQLRLTPDLIPNAHIAAGVRHNFVKTGRDATVWNVSGRYDLNDSLFVRGEVGTAFRLPDAESLFAIDPINSGEVGNPNLKPERSRNFNASVGGQGAGWSWELIGFWRETKDLISLSGATPDPDVQTFINVPGKVKARGFEAAAAVEPANWLSVKGSYTHTRTRQSGAGSVQISGVPNDFAQAVFDLHPTDAIWGGSASVSWVGKVYDFVASGFGAQQRGDYAVVDLAAWLKLGPTGGRLTARLENALDEDYSTHLSRATRDAGGAYLVHYLGAPRMLHVGYEYSF